MVGKTVQVYFLMEVYFPRLLLVSYRAYVSLDVNNPIMVAYAWNGMGTGFAVGDKQIKSIFPPCRLWNHLSKTVFVEFMNKISSLCPEGDSLVSGS